MEMLNKIFLSKTRTQIFKTFFLKDNSEYYLRELERLTGIGLKSLQTEIRRLVSLDLLLERKDGNRTYIRANTMHPLFSDFQSIVNKTCGPETSLKKILEGLDEIRYAFIFGSFAQGNTHAQSDLDLFIVGDISSKKLSDLLWKLQKEIPYEINEHNYSLKTLKKEINSKKHFIMAMKSTKRIFLKGDEIEFNQLFE